MQAFSEWWSTIQWADFSVGAVLAAAITGGLGFLAHVYNKRAALEAQEKEHKHQIEQSDRAHERDLKKSELARRESERAEVVSLLEAFEVDARAVSRSISTLYAHSLLIRNLSDPEKYAIPTSPSSQPQEPVDPSLYEPFSIDQLKLDRRRQMVQIRQGLDSLTTQVDTIMSKSEEMGLAARGLLWSFNAYKTTGISELDSFEIASKHHDAFNAFREKVQSFRRAAID